MREFGKRVGVTVFRAAAIAGFVCALPFLYVLQPWLRVRLAHLREDRIGHLASNTELYARELQQRPRSAKVVFFVWNPANRQLLDMWKRHLRIAENLWLKRAYLACKPIIERTRLYEPLPEIPVEEAVVFLECPPTLSFTVAEQDKGRRGL